MKVLLTGGTGFLGKKVLSQLLLLPQVTRVVVVTRTLKSHPSPRVHLLNLDLSHPSAMNSLPTDIDCVVHLAGLYDFEADFTKNYIQNVVPTLNLLDKMRELNTAKRVPLLFASTYAVGFGLKKPLLEEPVTLLPPKSVPYAFSKATAEKAVTESGIPAQIFRFGILVGEQENGAIEKVDGPYTFVRLISKLGSLAASLSRPRHFKILTSTAVTRWGYLPFPGDSEGILPFVPVDVAAKVVTQSVDGLSQWTGTQEIYGVYNPSSVTVKKFSELLLGEYMPGFKPVFVSSLPAWSLKFQRAITQVSGTSFEFALNPLQLSNLNFVERFKDVSIPPFESYAPSFFQGYQDYVGEGPNA
ncbi:SDR family oxidoreductase [bacterium]|jgi:nucleoside-diphosphate-sugar epimerase|nr:SDR family oxidoreductase [bacterium]